MIIEMKEVIEFTYKERNVINEMIAICNSVMNEAKNPELIKVAQEVSNKIYELWGYEKV